MTRKRLFIHIGHLKTGSSAIQNMLWENRNILSSNGLGIVETGFVKEKTIGNRHYLLGQEVGSPTCLWPLVKKEIEASSQNQFVVSYEGLIRLDEGQVQFIASTLEDFDVKIICYLRNREKFVQAYYTEYVKNHGLLDGFKPFCAKHMRLCEYGKLLDCWADAFGTSKVEVLNYDEIIKSDLGLEDTFLKQIGMSGIDEWQIEKARSNPSLSLASLQLIYNLNYLNIALKKKRSFSRYLQSLDSGKKRKPSFFSSRDFDDFVMTLKSDEENLARRFGLSNTLISRNDSVLEFPDHLRKNSILVNWFSWYLESRSGKGDLSKAEMSRCVSGAKVIYQLTMLPREHLKKIKLLNQFNRFCFRAYRAVKRRIPRSYKSWIKKSERFTPLEDVVESEVINVIYLNGTSDLTSSKEVYSNLKKSHYKNFRLTIISSAQAEFEKVFGTNEHVTLFNTASELVDSLKNNEWGLFLNSRTMLNQHSLSEFAFAASGDSGAKLIYSDYDFLDKKGTRIAPNFNPDWNPDLHYQQNYINGCFIAKTEVLKSYGESLLRDYSNQAFDFINYVFSQYGDSGIKHIPRVLFHLTAEPVKLDIALVTESLKNYVSDDVNLKLSDKGYKLEWPIPQSKPKVSLIIPTRDGVEILSQAVESILRLTTYKNYEVVIVDNQSVEKSTIDYFERIQAQSPKVRVVEYNHPFNYSAINNYAVSFTEGEIIGFINNDIEVISPGWLDEMVSHALRPDIGCVGAKLYYPNDTVQHAGVIVGLWGGAGHGHKGASRQASGFCNRLSSVQNYTAVTAACLLVRRTVFDEVGGFNEEALPVAFNDVDLCLKVVEKGYRNLFTPYAELYHHESVSRGKDVSFEQIARAQRELDYMHRVWNTHAFNDPCYSPNLTLEAEDFSISRQ